MQGPIQPRQGRRAGDPSGSPDGRDGNLKDWQKNTWFGPAPTNNNGNPFDEPEDSPELREVRSSNVSDHSGMFWSDQGQPTGYQYSSGAVNSSSSRRAADIRREERGVSLRAVWILVLLIVTTAAVLYFGVFRIREIRVIGNRDISAADIIRFSGIRRGDSILRLSERDTEHRLINAATSAAVEQGNYSYYQLQFRYLEKELPGTVTIAVREREACCWLTWCGILYVMDKNGTVLYETEDSSMRDRVKLVEVKGLDIRSGAQAGQTMVMASATQELLFRDLFMEMKVLGCTEKIMEADLSNPSSVVMDKLNQMGYTGGSINVANPETPSFSPASPQ